MLVEFTKMNGAGNDFVLIDNRDKGLELAPQQVARLCHRQRGIGADGLILLKTSSGQADFAWDFFNSDGSAGEMCGNGARCFARYVVAKTGLNRPITFETLAGIITATFGEEDVTVSLTTPKDLRINDKLVLSNGEQTVHSLNTGVPHAVLFVPDADRAMVRELGPEVRHHAHFAPKGANVNFVQILGPNSIRVRTFERGVEGETLACGTGVTASALIAACAHQFTSPVSVQVLAGDVLRVQFEQQGTGFANVRLTGPAEFVFEGQISI